MPLFKIAGQPVHVWFPKDRILSMETNTTLLTTNVRALLVTEKGPAVGTFEVEGRCDVLGAKLDRGEPVEVGS